MSVLEEAGRLIRSGRTRDGVVMVERAAASADPEAIHALASWRLYGTFGPRDLAAVHRLLERGVALGFADSIRLRAHLLANGTGVAEDPEAARALLTRLAANDAAVAEELALADAPEPEPGAIEPLSRGPRIEKVPGLLSAAECDYLIRAATPRLQPSSIYDPVNRRQIPHPYRTSLGVNFGPEHEDLVVHRINRRIAATSGTALAAGEILHVLAYSPGQQYRLHSDAIPGEANQRTHTLLVWLNDAYEGGATVFPALDIAVRGAPGDALLFENLTAAGKPDERTRHAGLPVKSGRKWLATRWIRRTPVSPFD